VSPAVPVNVGQGSHGRWINPAPSCIKINWDAALDGRKKIMGMGIIARDCIGVVKAAMCAVIPYIRDPTVAEALGARRAVEFGRDMGYEAIELEGDASEIVEAIGNSAKTANRFGGIIRRLVRFWKALVLGEFLL